MLPGYKAENDLAHWVYIDLAYWVYSYSPDAVVSF